jgi:hypothetical protein
MIKFVHNFFCATLCKNNVQNKSFLRLQKNTVVVHESYFKTTQKKHNPKKSFAMTKIYKPKNRSEKSRAAKNVVECSSEAVIHAIEHWPTGFDFDISYHLCSDESNDMVCNLFYVRTSQRELMSSPTVIEIITSLCVVPPLSRLTIKKDDIASFYMHNINLAADKFGVSRVTQTKYPFFDYAPVFRVLHSRVPLIEIFRGLPRTAELHLNMNKDFVPFNMLDETNTRTSSKKDPYVDIRTLRCAKQDEFMFVQLALQLSDSRPNEKMRKNPKSSKKLDVEERSLNAGFPSPMIATPIAAPSTPPPPPQSSAPAMPADEDISAVRTPVAAPVIQSDNEIAALPEPVAARSPPATTPFIPAYNEICRVAAPVAAPVTGAVPATPADEKLSAAPTLVAERTPLPTTPPVFPLMHPISSQTEFVVETIMPIPPPVIATLVDSSLPAISGYQLIASQPPIVNPTLFDLPRGTLLAKTMYILAPLMNKQIRLVGYLRTDTILLAVVPDTVFNLTLFEIWKYDEKYKVNYCGCTHCEETFDIFQLALIHSNVFGRYFTRHCEQTTLCSCANCSHRRWGETIVPAIRELLNLHPRQRVAINLFDTIYFFE